MVDKQVTEFLREILEVAKSTPIAKSYESDSITTDFLGTWDNFLEALEKRVKEREETARVDQFIVEHASGRLCKDCQWFSPMLSPCPDICGKCIASGELLKPNSTGCADWSRGD